MPQTQYRGFDRRQQPAAAALRQAPPRSRRLVNGPRLYVVPSSQSKPRWYDIPDRHEPWWIGAFAVIAVVLWVLSGLGLLA